jgi:hypothetical protein
MKWVRNYGREQLEATSGGNLELRVALCRYLKQGAGAGFSTEELVDWLGVSTPSILKEAGFDESGSEAAMNLLGSLSDEEIDSIRIGPEKRLP